MKTLSIVIPVYNEEDRLEKTFKALSELQLTRDLKLDSIIFVNDGSTDNTANLIKNFIKQQTNTYLPAEAWAKAGNLQLISYSYHRGKGYAVKVGMEKSTTDYTLFCDADMSTPMEELTKFIPHMEKNMPIIIGTRKNSHSTVITHQPLHREILGRGFTLISKIILDTWVSDFTCGFKAFSKEAKKKIFKKLKINGWSFDAEVLFLAKKIGLKVVEVPVVWSDDKKSKVHLWKDLPLSLYELAKIRAGDMKGLNFLQTVKEYLF